MFNKIFRDSDELIVMLGKDLFTFVICFGNDTLYFVVDKIRCSFTVLMRMTVISSSESPPY